MTNCRGCGIEIPSYPECQGGLGFVSPLSDEAPGSLKEAMVEGHRAFGSVEKQVCMSCYCDDFEKAYPGVECHLREKADFIKADPDLARRLGLIS